MLFLILRIVGMRADGKNSGLVIVYSSILVQAILVHKVVVSLQLVVGNGLDWVVFVSFDYLCDGLNVFVSLIKLGLFDVIIDFRILNCNLLLGFRSLRSLSQ